jgi:KaiC/GvpD/RAD55 family RecA-like ATPase
MSFIDFNAASVTPPDPDDETPPLQPAQPGGPSNHTGHTGSGAPAGTAQAGAGGLGVPYGNTESESAAFNVMAQLFAIHTLTNEDAEKMINQRFIIPNLIPEGMITVYPAPANGGKTAIFTHYACEIAKAGYFVIYINADASPSQLKAQQEKADRFGFKILAPDAKDAGGVKGLFEAMEALNIAKQDLSRVVFIVDTVKKFAKMLDKESIQIFLNLLRKLAAKGATFCLLGHTNKYLDADGNLVFEGMGDLRTDVDNMIYLYSSISEKDEERKVLEVTAKPDKVRAMFVSISWRLNVTSEGVTVHPLKEVLPCLTDELRQMLNAAINGINANITQQEDLVTHCAEETMTGVNKTRDLIKKLAFMENAPLIRNRAPDGNGYSFSTPEHVARMVEKWVPPSNP